MVFLYCVSILSHFTVEWSGLMRAHFTLIWSWSLFLSSKNVCLFVFCVCASMYECPPRSYWCLGRSEQGDALFGSVVTGSCESDVDSENLGILQEQKVS